MENNIAQKFPDLSSVATSNNISEDLLLKIYEIESEFHKKIKSEQDFERRKAIYDEFYKNYYKLPFPKINAKDYFQQEVKAKEKVIATFYKELANKSIIDIGCGSGCFIYALAKNKITEQPIYGIDAKKPEVDDGELNVRLRFDEKNVIKFDIEGQYDVAISDNVYEHIAPNDTDFYIESCAKTIKKSGKLILLIPHRDFGPWDYTTIKDNSKLGKISAECAHLNETTFSETIKILEKHGFESFESPLPFIAFSKIKDFFPNFRVSSKFYAKIERNFIFRNILKKIIINKRPLFRMEVQIIGTKK